MVKVGFIRKYLSADGLHQTVRQCLQKEAFEECERSDYSWQDCIMSGLAIFGFKFPSMLKFEQKKKSDPILRRNLHNLYGVSKVPSDTRLRERLDQVSPRRLRRPFKEIFAHLQRGKLLEQYRYLEGHHIISIDGTGQYSSKEVSCENCCEKKHRNGEITYYHHMLGAALVHPDKKPVIPLAPEPIVKGDGSTKNDCERNASKRLLLDLRREHPHLKILIVEDGLASNYPHLSLLDELKMSYVIGVKPGDHEFLFDWINHLKGDKHTEIDAEGNYYEFHYYSDVPLNDTNYDYRVNVIECREKKKSGKELKFSWVTKIAVTAENVSDLMRAGRSRWRIENETFNTLKNQGYNFEHNYGHGKKQLCSVMTMLMLQAFLIDQVQQLCCSVYQKARKKAGALYALFEEVRVLIRYAIWDDWHQLYKRIGWESDHPPPPLNTALPT